MACEFESHWEFIFRTNNFLINTIKKLLVIRKIDLHEIDWHDIQKQHNDGIFWTKLPKHFKISRKILLRAESEGFI